MRQRRSRRILQNLLLAAALVLPVGAMSQVNYLDQGSGWTDAQRTDFYSRDQGAQLMPLAWMKALKTRDGQPFLGDGLARYGYLPNPFRSDGVPIGFTVAGSGDKAVFGMNCAACHTRDIAAGGRTYRVDGGPALSDFQSFIADMVDAVGGVLASDVEFRRFSTAVLGAGASKKQIASLRLNMGIWFTRENAIRTHALPANPWGLGRLDAVSMIFNRLTGLDLGPPPTYLITANIKPADAPVRYPFLWNAPKQDRTQWPGFAANGSDILGLTRNIGEVIGVYGTFRPTTTGFFKIGGINFLHDSSIDFDGLLKLEKLVKQIGAPGWPQASFPVDQALAARGKLIYGLPTAQGGCASCHQIAPGKPAFPNMPTWSTPLMDVGTDSHEYDILHRTANPGVFANIDLKFLAPKVTNPAKSFDLLAIAVGGTILQSGAYIPAIFGDLFSQRGVAPPTPSAGVKQALDDAFDQEKAAATTDFKYESRVMLGIWAAAPYLHNGSVATLADLLEPASRRQVSFKVGPNYDMNRIGMAADQPRNYVRTTTGCEARNSGNSRCGHEFGTQLSDADKRALLEYLKML